MGFDFIEYCFIFSFRVQSCPSNDSELTCSGNGRCLTDGTCTCDARYTGDACNVEKCPSNCSNHGTCDMEMHRCKCDDGYKGTSFDYSICATLI
jgi:hypothetical protein